MVWTPDIPAHNILTTLTVVSGSSSPCTSEVVLLARTSYPYITHLWQECHSPKSMIFQENLLKVLKCYNFLWVQRRHNCSPVASSANCVMTLYLLKVNLQTFLSILIIKKCQILSCDTLVANERYVRLMKDYSDPGFWSTNIVYVCVCSVAGVQIVEAYCLHRHAPSISKICRNQPQDIRSTGCDCGTYAFYSPYLENCQGKCGR